MYQADDPTLDPQTWRHPRVLYACPGAIALLLALSIGSLPGLIATAAIGSTALGLMGAQLLISRRLGEACGSPHPAGPEAIGPTAGLWDKVL